jgi:heptosyltransferase-3
MQLTYERDRIQSILVVSFPVLGDALLSTPLVSALRKAYPDATIHMLVRGGVEHVLRGNPDIDEVLTIARRAPVSEGFALFRRIFRRYDLAVSTSHIDRATFNLVVAAPRRASIVPQQDAPSGQNLGLKRRVTQHWEYLDQARHFLHQTADLLGQLGIAQETRLTPPSDLSSQDTLAKQLGSDWTSGELVAFQVTAGRRFKLWSETGWADVARHYAKQGHRLVYLGGPSAEERRYIDEAIRHSGVPGANLAGATSLADVGCLLEQVALYVGLDTCNSHIAASVGAPVVTLFGSSNAVKWSPYPAGKGHPLTPFPTGDSAIVGNVALLRPERTGDEFGDLEGLRSSRVIEAGDQLINRDRAPSVDKSEAS